MSDQAVAERTMAKKKTARPKTPEPATRKNVVSIRGTENWRDWLMGLAAHRRLKASDVIDQALIEYAERHGYTREAPPR